MNRLARRKLVDHAMRTLCLGLAVLAIYPLFSVLWKVVSLGAPVVTWDFLTSLPVAPVFPGGGILNAIVGTGLVVGIGTAIGAPIGLLAGIYLAEYGRGRFAEVLRTTADALAGLPSILAGLFALVVVVRYYEYGFSAIAGGCALAVLMIPVVTRTTEESLRTVPATYREAALALGAPRWRAVLTVVLPSALGGVLTGLLLAVARIAGETAPVLLTTLTSFFLVTDPKEPVATLPVLVYTYGNSAYPNQIRQAWGAALVLILLVLIVNLSVRFLARRRVRSS